VALVQFSGDREGVSECHRIVTLDRDVGQSAAQLGKECDAGCVDGTEGLQSS